MFSKQGKSLIIGADGFLGKNMCHYFDGHGFPYIPIGKQEGDLRDRDNCIRIFSTLPTVERIFHLVTFQRTGNIQFEIPADLYQNNVRIHSNIVECWAKFQPQALFISTGSSCTYPDSDVALDESLFGLGPLHESVRYYALAKQFLVELSNAYAKQYGLKHLHCILSTLYGPHDHVESDRCHFINGMVIRALQEKQESKTAFTVFGSPDITRECLFVVDQIEAILLASLYFHNRVINCSANEKTVVTLQKVAETILKLLDWNATIQYPAQSFQGSKKKILDSSVFLQKTGWLPKTPLIEGLPLLIEDITKKIGKK